MMLHEDVQRLYEEHINTTVDYGQGPRSPISNKVKHRFITFEPDHSGMGFVGHVPFERMFFASDHHFGHANIIKYANRPFESSLEMNEEMVARHNAVVGPDDYTLFGGDIGFAPASTTNKYLARMNGYKIFVLGNHDFERDKTIKKYDVQERWLHWQPFRLEEEFDLVFTHYPLDNIPPHMINIHGHIHEKISPNPQHVNLCVEHTDYTPVNMTDVVKKARMAYIDSLG